MLKSDLINILVTKRGITQKQAEATIETIFESMKEALCRGENIEIRGLGAFHVKNYQGYQGRNPKTGEVIPVKPKRGLLFRTGKELRDRVNRPGEESASADLAVHGIVSHRPQRGRSLADALKICEYCRPFLCAPARDGISLGRTLSCALDTRGIVGLAAQERSFFRFGFPAVNLARSPSG